MLFSPDIMPSLVVLKIPCTNEKKELRNVASKRERYLVSVPGGAVSDVSLCKYGMFLHFCLVWTLNLKAKVICLDWGQFGELGVDMSQVKLGNSLVQDLWQNVDTDLKLLSLAELDILLAESSILALVQHDLCKNLVGE